MFKENFNTKKQGNVGLTAALFYFSKQGYTVSIPLNDSQDYDLVVDIKNNLNKVQVKTTRYKSKENKYTVELRSSGGTKGTVYHRVSEGNCDLLFVLDNDGNQYLIPKDIFKDYKSSIVLSEKFNQYKIE